jgi:phosphoglucomutase
MDEIYLRRLRDSVVNSAIFRERPITVAYTPLHGTGNAIMKPLMEQMGIQCHGEESQCRMDPNFSTVQLPNPENKEAFTKVLQLADEKKIDLALATDPDADRLAIAARNKDGQMQILSGNETAILLTAYRLETMNKARWFRGKRSANAAIIASYVTTPLLDELAHRAKVKMIRTLIGFKWIGEKLQDYERQAVAAYGNETEMPIDYRSLGEARRRELLLTHSTYLVLGAEESCGYMCIDATRDKDSHSAALMACEAFACLQSQRKTIFDYLDAIYSRYGYHGDRLHNIVCEGADGMSRMDHCLHSLAKEPITALGGQKVIRCTDFMKDLVRDVDGKEIPRVPFWIFDLEDGCRVAIRASGTEPKMKCYLFYRSPKGNLENAKVMANSRLAELATTVHEEMDRRMKS